MSQLTMINRHTIKAYAIANGWSQIKSNLAEGEEFVKDKFLFSLPTVDDLEVEGDVLSYAIQQIHDQEEIPLVELINKISNHWLSFDPDNIPEAKEGYALLVHDLQLDKIHAFKVYNGSWRIHPMGTSFQELIARYGADKYQNETYKLIQL